MSFCPAYWDWLDQQYQQGTLASIISVYDELIKQDDELSDWAKERKNQFLGITATDIQEKFANVAQYVGSLSNKNQEDVAIFLGGADPWLIAKAALDNATIVTHEVLVPPESRKVKLPNICEHFQVKHITTFNLLRMLNARFILE